MNVQKPRGHLLHQVFTVHETGEWPDDLDVPPMMRECSTFWAEKAAKRAPRAEGRSWPAFVFVDGARVPAMAVNVTDETGVDVLTTKRAASSVSPKSRLSRLAAKADRIADPKVIMGVHKRARLLRPVLLGVAALSAKTERAGVVAARGAKRAEVKAAYDARVNAKPIAMAEAAIAYGGLVYVGQVLTVGGELRRVAA
jgi:hypothetical protein